MRAVGTHYRGFYFRSLLEARWAVFLDALGIVYEYEPESFSMDGYAYVPDFFLPREQLYVEIKPRGVTERGLIKWKSFSREKSALLLVGNPWPEEYEGLLMMLHDEGYVKVKLALCRRCDALNYVWGEQFENWGSFRGCCDTDKQPDFYSQRIAEAYSRARSYRFW